MKGVNKIFVAVVILLLFVVNFILVNAFSQDGVLHSDNFDKSLNEIKDNPDFSITIGTEYFFIVENKKNGEKVKVNVLPEHSDKFERYSFDNLGIDLNRKLSRNTIKVTFNEKKSKREVENNQNVGNSGDSSQSTNSSSTGSNECKVIFNSNRGTGSNEIVENLMCLYKLPDSKFTSTNGKEFMGWSTGADGPIISGDTITIGGNTTLYAIWEGTSDEDSLKEYCSEEILKEYSLNSCPDGAICSYKVCGDKYRYKISSCQDDYELKDGSCQCHKQLHITGELAGEYSCSMCHQERGGNMCELDIDMESMCREYEDGRLQCESQRYYPDGKRMSYIFFNLSFDAADALGIDADSLAQTRTSISRGVRLHYGYRDGVDTEYDRYDHYFYMTEEDCMDVGEKYFGSGFKGKEIDLPYGYSDNICKQDCAGFDLNVCPENRKCLVCGDKFKIVGEQYENKGWKCYKLNEFAEIEESDECNCDSYVNKSKDGTWLTSTESGCIADTYMCESEDTGEEFYSGVCGACGPGYQMDEHGKCEYIPCGPEYWMESQMNIGCSDDLWIVGITCDDNYIRPTKEFVPMNGCTQAGKEVCEKHFGSDSYVGNQEWVDGYGNRDKRDGCTWDYAHTYFKCTECESGYTLVNDACVANSGIGSIYYYKGKPIGIVFEETERLIKVVSLQDLGGLTYDYTNGFTPRGVSYYWEEAMDAAKQYAPEDCEVGSFCAKGKWRIPTLEEMQKVSKNFDDGGPLLQAIRGLESSCSKENSMMLLTNRYWTSTSTIAHTNVESAYGGEDINAAYVVYHPIKKHVGSMGKKDSIAPSMRYARPVLTIRKVEMQSVSFVDGV